MLGRYVTLRKCFHLCLLLVLVVLLWCSYRTLYASHPYVTISCPLTINDSLCQSIFDGSSLSLAYAERFPWCSRHDIIHDSDYVIKTKDCHSFIASHGYLDHSVTEEEVEFPIAFSILMHENLEQVERLLRLIYRPQNVYCIHVDRKAAASIHQAANAIAGCFDNVFVASKVVDVHWGEYTLLEAELACLKQLLDDFPAWKYYINLMGREFPLRTNQQLVQIFKAYNGANDVDGTHHRRPIVWTMFVWRNENWRTSTLKSDPPHNFLIAKGSAHVALSRKFAEFAVYNQKAKDLLKWMKDIRAPEEHFYPTLNHNPTLNIPGAYRGDPDLKWFQVRLKIWQSETETCHGEWIRYICNIGVGDLPRLTSSKQLFFNKIRLEQDPVAFRCLETWYRKRTEGLWKDSFSLSFYSNLTFVNNHV